ncbi:MAG: exosortase/archaeosortase family protein [Armatimonadota bacterium]|nr:exosortase/archaeosortase family protein [Armatimonadota bacterium]
MATTVEQTTPRSALTRLDWLTLLPFAATIVLLALLTKPTLVSWFENYVTPESYYAHAPAIPFLMALMFWAKRETLNTVPKAPCLAALAVFLPALALYVFAGQNYAQALMSFSFLLIVWSGVWLALGTRFVRTFWAPLAMLALMAPLPGPLLNDSTLRIQMASTSFANVLLRCMTFHTVLHGNVIEMDSFPLWVDTACSGFKLLLSMLTFSGAFAYLVDGTRAKRAALFLVALPLAVLINSVRIALIGVVGECVGPAAAHVFHDWSGIVTLVLGFAALFSLAKVFGCRTFAGWAIF